MMDEKDDTLNLSFGTSAGRENADVEYRFTAPNPALRPAAAPAASPSAAKPLAASTSQADSSATVLPEPVIRSRQPINRPAGTPPLSAAPETTSIPHPAVNANYGAALRAIREAARLDYKDVERGTQIAVRYLEAIETENLDKLPPLVYVIAYIRTLCRFYHVSNADADHLVSKLKEQLEYPCNQELMNSLEVDNSGAEDNEKRLRRMFLIAGSIAAGVVVVLALILFLALRTPSAPEPEAKPDAKQSETVSKFDTKSIEPLLEPAKPQLMKVPIAE